MVPGVYALLMERERQADARCDVIRLYPPECDDGPVMRRPRRLLDALEAGQPAAVDAQTVRAMYWAGRGSDGLPWPPGTVKAVLVRPDDTVIPGRHPDLNPQPMTP